MEDADKAVGQLSERLAMGLAPGSQLVVVAAGPGEGVSAQKAHWSQASPRRRLRAKRANTTRLRPDALVMGDVPA